MSLEKSFGIWKLTPSFYRGSRDSESGDVSFKRFFGVWRRRHPLDKDFSMNSVAVFI
jgi:hypothetical protein